LHYCKQEETFYTRMKKCPPHLNIVLTLSVVWYPRHLDTYCQYLRVDTSIAKVTIYRCIS